ncbi:MAG: CHAT domain-containing protein [Oculatellaceae cyanobacterium bins.114]|nr:CHAT domain-containing protein [Oculatellaceae cyanobacterium bins.114]
MFLPESPCLSLAIAPLTAAEPDHYAIWVLQAPYPGGYVHHDRRWTQLLTEAWHNWQNMFSIRSLPPVPRFPRTSPPVISPITSPPDPATPPLGQPTSKTGLLMQNLGVNLWHWLFDESPIQISLERSQGIAIGQGKPLRIRLEVRDPDLISVPWEIMQPQPGKQAVSLSQQLLFSRTTSDVDALPLLRVEHSLQILLVLGQDEEMDVYDPAATPTGDKLLKLEQEAKMLADLLEAAADANSGNAFSSPVPCQVKTLVQPTPGELIDELESGSYNVLFYSGHGVPAPDGGLLFVRPNAPLNGTELAQVLTRCQVKLAVFNTCWGAQPDHDGDRAIPRSSLAEVLIHHGVPAVLGMRDSIADQEALSFIREFTQALSERAPIDQAVAIARQHLLTLYKFNQPAWTLPVLYMHPEFNGELVKPMTEGVTEIPENSPSWIGRKTPTAFLRSLTSPSRTWQVHGGIMRVGSREGNDLVIREPGVSRVHAEIFYRDSFTSADGQHTYFLKDYSRFGTLVLMQDGWHRVHHQEVPLLSKTQLRFGHSSALEFVIDG